MSYLNKIDIAKCGQIITIRRDNMCVKCRGKGCSCCNKVGPFRGVHHKVAVWERLDKERLLASV